MRAMVMHRFGQFNEFELVNIDKPKIKPGEVLIKVSATSVNPLDYKIRSGVLSDLVTQFPIVLHGDVAGVVAEVAHDVQTFKKGDEVYGCVGGFLNMQGALAEYVAADANLISLKPKKLDMYSSAALPLVAETAWEGLINKANIKAGQTVLVHGGTGGVGHVAIQLAKVYGAKVFATVSDNNKAQIALNLGADIVINYKTESVHDYIYKYTNNNGFDIVFDTIGFDNLNKSIDAVAENGAVITIMPHGLYDLTNLFLKNANLYTVFQPLPLINQKNRSEYNKILTEIANLVDSNHLKALIDPKIFSLEDVGHAHNYLEQGKAIGKVIIKVDHN
jgi:NADPH2:quinone reductase